MPPLSYPRPVRVFSQDLSRDQRSFAVATGLSSGEEATPALAAAAVQQALRRAGRTCANSVLLFLTPDFARHAQAAVTAVSHAANCLQVAGACVPGVLTETDWLLDRPGAAALVLCGDLPAEVGGDDVATVSLAHPEAVSPAWLAASPLRCGGVSTDAGTLRAGRVWNNAKVGVPGECSITLAASRTRIGISRGILPIGAIAAAVSEGYELLSLSGVPALAALRRALPDIHLHGPLPIHQVCAGVLDADDPGESAAAIAAGRYQLVPVIAVNAESGSLTMAAQIADGRRVFWALRNPDTAQRDMDGVLAELASADAPPSFALMFSCMGRGPYFYGGDDSDLDLFRSRFPGVPLLGAYCAGEIAPLPSGNALIHNGVVLALYDRIDVQSDA